jgi:hypothetical protein
MATLGKVAVIVAQAGVDASAPLPGADEVSPTTLVLQQEPGESLPAMGQRVRNSLSELANQGLHVQSATFVARKGFGLGDVLGTADLLRVLLAAMMSVGSGHVYLRGDALDNRAQVALRALADAIRDQIRGTGIHIVSGAAAEPHEARLASALS